MRRYITNLRAITIIFFILQALVLQGQVAEPGPRDAVAESKPASQTNWTERKTLPLLRVTPLKPIKNTEQFETIFDTLIYRAPKVSPKSGERFKDDVEALRAAKSWLREHFGDFTDPLFLKRIARGNDVSRDPDGPDLVLILKARHHGIPLEHGGASISFTGRDVVSATVELFSVTPVADSDRSVISKDDAIRKLADAIPKDMIQGKGLEDVKLELVYAWSIWDNRMDQSATEKGVSILRPNWQVASSIIMIDAFDGKVWRNG